MTCSEISSWQSNFISIEKTNRNIYNQKCQLSSGKKQENHFLYNELGKMLIRTKKIFISLFCQSHHCQFNQIVSSQNVSCLRQTNTSLCTHNSFHSSFMSHFRFNVRWLEHVGEFCESSKHNYSLYNPQNTHSNQSHNCYWLLTIVLLL